MGNRLTQIYTRTGDLGETGLADGSRVSKASARIQLMGDVDELNSAVGGVLSHLKTPELSAIFEELQHLLFDLGGDLSIPGRSSLSTSHVEWLEVWMDHFNESLPPLKEFVLPGGSDSAAWCHLARTICRRVERTAIAAHSEIHLHECVIPFVNRLSDFLFVAARVLAREGGGQEVLWLPKERTRPLPA